MHCIEKGENDLQNRLGEKSEELIRFEMEKEATESGVSCSRNSIDAILNYVDENEDIVEETTIESWDLIVAGVPEKNVF